jgi:hypothetical protein
LLGTVLPQAPCDFSSLLLSPIWFLWNGTLTHTYLFLPQKYRMRPNISRPWVPKLVNAEVYVGTDNLT